MRQLLLLTALLPTVINMHDPIACYKPTPNIPTINKAEHKCLAAMVYGEARGESIKGMTAVAYTALNRANKRSVCDVVLAPKQYSIFNNNPALQLAATSMHIDPLQKNTIDKASWEKALIVAEKVLRREVPDPVNGATHYLAIKSLKRMPSWSKKFTTVAVIDNHTFYKSA